MTENSVVAEPRPDIGGTGRRALPLTAVLEFLLAGSGVERWPRRPELRLPYSRATRGNIAVMLTVGGAAAARNAA
jgi:hypothetical protein